MRHLSGGQSQGGQREHTFLVDKGGRPAVCMPRAKPQSGAWEPILESTEKATGWEGSSHVFSGQRVWTGNLMFGLQSWGGAPS